MKLEDIPDALMSTIKEYIRKKGNSAHDDFDDASANEDSLTGSFGKHMKKGFTKVRRAPGWRWRVRWRKMRSGKGRSAEEKLIGADGIIQLEAFDEDGTVFSKGLLFQAKKESDDDYDRLHGQCKKMEAFVPEGSAVFVYGEKGYTGQTSRDRTAATRASGPEPLGDFIADKFLECLIGKQDLIFETERNTLIVPESNTAVKRAQAKLNKLTIEVRAPGI